MIKFRLKIGIAFTLLGWGASPALAAPGQSLDQAISSLLSDGCGAGGTGGRLLSARDFGTVSTFTPAGNPMLEGFEIFRRTQDSSPEAESYSIQQIGDSSENRSGKGFVEVWSENKGNVFKLSLRGDGNVPRREGEIAYDLVINIPAADPIDPDNPPEFPGIKEGFNPQALENTILIFDGNNSKKATDPDNPRIAINDLLLRAKISQNFNVSTQFTPNVGVVGTGLAKLCTSTVIEAGRRRTGTQDFIFAGTRNGFNDQPGQRTGAAGFGSFAGIGSATGQTSSGTRGLAAIQAQEGVSRRQGGIASLIDRLTRKARQDRKREAAQRTYQIASVNDVRPPSSANPETASAAIVFDASAGILSLDRAATALEGSYSAESVVADLGGAVVFTGPFQSDDQALLGLGINFERTKSDRADTLAVNTSSFENDAVTVSAFIGWTSDVTGSPKSPAIVSTLFSAAYGQGDQSYERQFNFFRDNAAITAGAMPDASNTLEADLDQTFTSVSAQASLMRSDGPVTLGPRVSATYVKFETDRYKENVRAGQTDNGFALEYAPVEDEWSEIRVGGSVAYTAKMSERMLWQVALGIDSVFVMDAETPDRTAFFVQDLREQSLRVPIIYSVDNLDDQYYDIALSVSGSFAGGLQPSVSFFSRQGHDYIDAQGVLVGLRLAH